MTVSVHSVGWVFSIGVSYGLQRVFYLAPTKTDALQLLGAASLISGTQVASTFVMVRLIDSYEEYLALKIGVIKTVFVAATFFLNLGYQLIRSFGLSIDPSTLVLNAGKATGIYVLDTAVKLGILFSLAYLEDLRGYFLPGLHARWEQLKENMTLLCSHLARRYEYYTFPVYQTKDDLKALSKEELQAARVHYTSYPQVWEAFSSPMQLAFNLLLRDQELPLLPCTAPLEREGDYTKEELKLFASERYRYYQVTAEEASVFFQHHVKPPEYFLEKQSLPQFPIPEVSEIPTLSKAQIEWFHQLMVAKQVDLTSEQYGAFAKRFFNYNLLAPNENFVFDVELPPEKGYVSREKVYYYYLYVKAGRDTDLSLNDRVQLQQFLRKNNFACALPEISEKQLFFATREILSAYADQFKAHRFLWIQESASFRREFNCALNNHGLGQIQERRFASLRDGFSRLVGNVFGFGYYSDATLMGVSDNGQNLEYLQDIPVEQVNYLHPSMIRHLPDEKIVHITRPDLIRAIPKSKLLYVHPKVYPLLTATQKVWMNKCLEDIAGLSKEQIRLLLCSWLVRQVPEDKMFEVSKAGKEFVFRPTKISPFHQAFFSLVHSSPRVWEEMMLIEQTLFDLVPFGSNRFVQIEAISDNLREEFRHLTRFFGVRVLPELYQVQKLFTPGSVFFADDPITAEDERKKMLYQFKHLVYVLKKMMDVDPPLDNETKATVGTLLKQLFHAMADCKNAWISALTNFEGKRNEFCDCPDCKGVRENSKEVLLKSRLAGKLAVFKRECFQKVILQAYNFGRDEDGQQVHTIDWYARELPHLNLHSGYSDRYALISRREVTPLEMQKRMIHEYKESVRSYLKDLLSYGKNGDIEFRELALDFMSGVILREAQRRKAFIDPLWAKDVASSWIWDEENAYEVRDAFVGIMLYSFGHFGFDPLSKVFSQTQSNKKLLSENLDLVSIKLTQLDGAK